MEILLDAYKAKNPDGTRITVPQTQGRYDGNAGSASSNTTPQFNEHKTRTFNPVVRKIYLESEPESTVNDWCVVQ